MYARATVLIGPPDGMTSVQREQYQGQGAKTITADLTHDSQHEIASLLAKAIIN